MIYKRRLLPVLLLLFILIFPSPGSAQSDDDSYTKTDIMRLKVMLLRLGYDAGNANSAMDAKAARAISQFQEESTLPTSGIFDSATADALAHAYYASGNDLFNWLSGGKDIPVFSHGGIASLGDSHTVFALDTVLAQDYPRLSLNISLSSDGTLLAIGHEQLRRNPSELSYAEILTRIPGMLTARQLLDMAPENAEYVFHVDTTDAAEAIALEMESRGLSAILVSKHTALLSDFSETHPEIPTGLVVDIIGDSWATAEKAIACGAEYLFAPPAAITENNSAILHDRGLSLGVMRVEDASQVVRSASLSADLILSTDLSALSPSAFMQVPAPDAVRDAKGNLALLGLLPDDGTSFATVAFRSAIDSFRAHKGLPAGELLDPSTLFALWDAASQIAALHEEYADERVLFSGDHIAWLCAHRGAQSPEIGENTLESFHAAVASGVKWLELDVWMTADGIPVCIHDKTINRTSDGTGAVSRYTYSELLEYDYRGTIATLEEALAILKDTGITVMIELKGPGTAIPAAELVRNFGMQEQVTYDCFDINRLREVRTVDPNARTILQFSSRINAERICEQLAENGDRVFGVMLSFHIPNAEMVDIFHRNGYHVSAYLDGEQEILRGAALGVDVILVDDIYLFD